MPEPLAPLRTEAAYEAALAELDTLMDAAPGTPEEARLRALAEVVCEYEQEHYPIDPPDPAAAAEFEAERLAANESATSELRIPCLIYSRIVGYMTPTENWNAGKQQEFAERVTYRVESAQ